MALSGTTTCGCGLGSRINRLANMPGSSLPSGLAMVARTSRLRVVSSTLGLMALRLPGKRWPG
ncbi:hypothetical protein D3C78_1576690 [compost metagenome]